MSQMFAFMILISLVMTGCLRTRQDLRADNKPTPAQAAEQAKLEEQNQQMRELQGRLEVLEHELKMANQKRDEVDPTAVRVEELEKKLKYYEEAIVKLEKQIEEAQKPPPPPPQPEAKPKSVFDQADSLFEEKKWKEAIIGFQKYRDNNPKGTKYADATYKIGVSFQELGMKAEARAFFEEVIEKYPKDGSAKRAKYRLTQLK